eukprot:5387736-Prorocentrum_lima.AAC.1
MTSSLVGSEMCIRDSADRGARFVTTNTFYKRHDAAEDEDIPEDHNTLGSVSYTHLTLPTICSV